LAQPPSWQPGESSIDDFKNSYDWAFYRNNDDRTFAGVIENLDRRTRFSPE
jgi:hypothetical protein